jgi:hypothetical protein
MEGFFHGQIGEDLNYRAAKMPAPTFPGLLGKFLPSPVRLPLRGLAPKDSLNGATD